MVSINLHLFCVLAVVSLVIRVEGTVPPEQRIDCFPDPGYNQDACKVRGCVSDNNYDQNHPTVPLCYFPAGNGYLATNQSVKTDSTTAILSFVSGATKNPFGTNFQQLSFTSTHLGSAVKVSIKPVGVERYVPPVSITETHIQSTEALSVKILNNANNFSFQVVRNSNNVRLWDTSIGGLQFADQYIQIATYLPTDRIYGFGENIHQNIKHDFTKYTTWGMYARDQGPNSNNGEGENLYGVQPFYLGLEKDGKAHGVFIFNSNPQDITTGPAPHLVYRTIGGQLDIYYFPGPAPEDVIKQYQEVIGKPFLPAYWALGYQLSRYGYTGVDDVKDTMARTKAAGIPQDVQFADIDYMERYKDFTYDHDKWEQWPNFTDYLHRQGQRVFLIFDPAIQADYESFERAIKQNVSWIEWPRNDLVMRNIQDQYPLAKNTKIMLGVVWPDKHVGFPDFLDPTNITTNWWADEFKRYHDIQKFDGIWIDMNEPSNFGTNEDHPWYYDSDDHPNDLPLKCPTSGDDAALDVPPYQTKSVYIWGNKSVLASNTLCAFGTSIRGQTSLYNTKNLYGHFESIATWQALKVARGKRAAIVSRSTFPGSGTVAGHWLGDNTARWDDLRTSIIGVQEFNLFGIPYVGADICGFTGPTNEELCLRWQQLGAFHSFMRNHNMLGVEPQDPAQWPTVAKATRIANLFRYRHLPYLFSLHFNATRFGGTVIRPLFFEFPLDATTYTLSYQFLWGPAVLVAPVFEPGVKTVRAYLPIETSWYSLSSTYYGSKLNSGHGIFPAPWNSIIPTFLRAGYILPRQAPALTTTAARLNQFELVIGSLNDPSGTGSAAGELYWDDGEEWIDIGAIEQHNYYHFTFKFAYTKASATLQITSQRNATGITLPMLNNIEVFGYMYIPDQRKLYVNGEQTTVESLTYSPFTQVVNIMKNNLIDLNKLTTTLQWKNR